MPYQAWLVALCKAGSLNLRVYAWVIVDVFLPSYLPLGDIIC